MRVFPYPYDSIRHFFDRAVRLAGLGDFHFHDLRHTFATRLVQSGIDHYRVKELLGHRTVTTTERYAHHYSESLREAVKVLDDVTFWSRPVDQNMGKCCNIKQPEWRNWQTQGT